MSARIYTAARVGRYRPAVDPRQILDHLLDQFEAGRFGHSAVRCDWCNPMANPRPLSIDGHAYHRRTRARRRNR